MHKHDFPSRRALRLPAFSFLKNIDSSVDHNFCSAASEQTEGIYKFDLNKDKFEQHPVPPLWYFAIFIKKSTSNGIAKIYTFDYNKLKNSLLEHPEIINKNASFSRYLLSINLNSHDLHGMYSGKKPIISADYIEEYIVYFDGEKFISDNNPIVEYSSFDDQFFSRQFEWLIKKESNSINKTEISREIKSRIGQSIFRKNLMYYWGNKCCVTGISLTCILRASHIKPWSKSTDEERLSISNGLLLNTNLDALFDNGLISFSDDGRILISNSISNDQRRALCIHNEMSITKQLGDDHKKFLAYHRESVFRTP